MGREEGWMDGETQLVTWWQQFSSLPEKSNQVPRKTRLADRINFNLTFFFPHNTACISGSREAVQVYIRIRELASGRINLCRVVDFQVFMAAVIVILGLLGYRPTSVPRNYS